MPARYMPLTNMLGDKVFVNPLQVLHAVAHNGSKEETRLQFEGDNILVIKGNLQTVVAELNKGMGY